MKGTGWRVWVKSQGESISEGTGWRVRGESVGGESEVSLWIESQG